MVSVNFIIPSWSYWKEPLRAQPLTQMYLATIIEQYTQIEFTDLRDGPKVINEADIYFYTIASPDYKECKHIMGLVRKLYPNSLHVAGGPHPSIVPEETEGFDSLVIGKGEESIKQILRDYPNLEKQYNLPINENYPFPKRHFLSKDKIINPNLFKTDKCLSTTAQFSFGCPFNCSFCANYTKGKIRRNSLEKIGKEIDYLKSEYGIEGFSLQDEIAIPLDKKEAYDFLGLLESKNIKWRGQIRVLKDYDLLKKAKQSGLVELSFGLESVDQNVIDKTNKNILVSDVEEMLGICKKLDIKTRIYLLNGLPFETENIANQTKDFINRTNPDLVLLSSLQPYPGSPIADNPEKYDIKWISKDYDKFNHLMCRFKDSDDNPEDAVPYEYKHGLSRKQIMNNLLDLQEFLRGEDMNK